MKQHCHRHEAVTPSKNSRLNLVYGLDAVWAQRVESACSTGEACPSAQVAVAWLLSRPFVTAPIVGANSPEQLRSLLPAAALTLTGAELDRLNTVSSWEKARTELDGHETF